jgi:hypothetical protein
MSDTNNVKIRAYQSVRYVFCMSVIREVAYHGLSGLSGFGVKREVGKVIVFRVGSDG